jgi:hypothetical protein
MYLKIPSQNLIPRHYQKDFLNAVYQGRNVVSVIHRRAGKDTISIQAILLRALTRVGTHIYLAPLLTQIRQIIWQGMTADGRPFLDFIPNQLVEGRNEARMEIKLINGSVIKFAGSNNFNGLMGTNPVTIIYSEYSLHNPLARQFLNPILVENGGQEICQYTPRGMNHGYDLLEVTRNNPKYFVQHLGVHQTFKDDAKTIPVVSEEQIAEAKAMGMSEEMIKQEFFVDFEVGNVGAYFTREMSDLMSEGRAKVIAPNPSLPLHTAWDLGGTDATACWIYQVDGRYVNLLHLIHEAGQGLKYYLDRAEQYRRHTQCQWGQHFMPHDIKQGHQGWESTESRLTKARRAGWTFTITPKANIEDGIEAMRSLLPYTRINVPECQTGLTALREYQRTYDELRGVYAGKPLHNWSSHIVDAYRYLALNYRRLFGVGSGKVYRYEVG